MRVENMRLAGVDAGGLVNLPPKVASHAWRLLLAITPMLIGKFWWNTGVHVYVKGIQWLTNPEC
jgi:hypothetical protein